MLQAVTSSLSFAAPSRSARLAAQSSSEVTVALMTLETALKAANMQRMPTSDAAARSTAARDDGKNGWVGK